MPPDEPTDKLQGIEKRLAKLEERGKDHWDKFQIVASLLIPAAVAVAGYYFSEALSKAQTASARLMADAQRLSEEQRAQASQMVAEASMHVTQAQLVASFMQPLLSNNRAEKELAIRAVLLALPEDGPRLVDAVRTGAADSQTRALAEVALNDRRDKLVEDVYAADTQVRQKATAQLVQGFRQDPSLVDSLAREAQRHSDNTTGVLNSAVVLQSMPTEQLKARQHGVRQFVQVANQGSQQT